MRYNKKESYRQVM